MTRYPYVVRGRRGLRARVRGLVGVTGAILMLAAGNGPATAADTIAWGTSLSGMSGLVFTPTADVMLEGSFRVGYAVVDEKWAFDLRNLSDNRIYFFSVGFLKRLEVSLRGTIFPNDVVRIGADESLDRLGSARFVLLPETERRPGLAAGVDDAYGTRRFHSLYAVATKHLQAGDPRLTLGISIGYGSRLLNAKNYLLDGGFGGLELKFADFVSGVLEFDSEKWNTSGRLVLFRHLAAQLAFLNLETPSGGVSWTQRF